MVGGRRLAVGLDRGENTPVAVADACRRHSEGQRPDPASPFAGAVTPVELPLFPTYWPLVTGLHSISSTTGQQ